MKTIDEVTADKLRGGFYSPRSLVDACLDRVSELMGSTTNLRVLEPSVGDGAFIRGLKEHRLRAAVTSLTAVEVIPSEAEQCARSAATASFSVDLRCGSFLDEALLPEREFDVALGNPPFVRFQFISDRDRLAVDDMAARMGISVRGVSNLWIPILLNALEKIRQDGVFAFIVPTECLTGISASVVRSWLLENITELQVDIFSPGSFPGVLQEIVVLSGRKNRLRAVSELTIREHQDSGRSWKHVATKDDATWTRYLLSPTKLRALDDVASLPQIRWLGQIFRFTVATVTGANDFFSVNEETVQAYDLHRWTRPLLPRIRNASGLVYSADDHQQNIESGVRAHILDFSIGPDPLESCGPARYLSAGESRGLPGRYKCRIRSPWYQVPIVPPGDVLLSKRCHMYPRVVMNQSSVITTDTIYQGRRLHGNRPSSFVASFHNSLTLLCAEIEGRSFGGGVLELVPSEISRLRVFDIPAMGDDLESLDAIARTIDPEEEDLLVQETDRRLAKFIPGLSDSLLTSLADARYELQNRRLERGRLPDQVQ